jgi:ubiquinone/menaquinone biosynthesis C-methylase UbiE
VTAKKIDTTRLQRLARAYAETAVFHAALDLELFTHIAGGADSIATLASAMDTSLLNAERLVVAVLALGLLEKDGDRLRNASDAERYLVRGIPAYASDWMLFTRADVPDWFRLTTLLQDKTPPTTLGMYADLSVASARAYHAATYSIGMGAGKRFCRRVDLSHRHKLLDVGGGSGAYSINAVKSFPALTAVVLDLPAVIEVTREYLERNGVSDRIAVLAGDFTVSAFPSDCDAAVMASNLPIYNETMIQAVVRKVHDALVPGGEFHLIGEMLNDDGCGPLDPALWGINEAVCRSAGKAHTIAQCVGYFRTAGFLDIAVEEFVPGTLQRVSGIKAD